MKRIAIAANVLLILAAILVIIRYSTLPPANDVELVESEEPVTVFEEIPSYSLSCDYGVGDLIPCEVSQSQFKLIVVVFANDSLVHNWCVDFCTFDGSNADPETKHELGRYHFSACGPSGGFSGSQHIEKLTSNSVFADINWYCSLHGTSLDFEFPAVFTLHSKGTIELDSNRRVEWSFQPSEAKTRSNKKLD